MPALIFDCDGVLSDTEQFGHLPAFNQAFREAGIPVRWTTQDYAEKVRIAGGKERMRSLFTPDFVRTNGLPASEPGQTEIVAAWHRRKTQIYTQLISSGMLPARPGIARIVQEAIDEDWDLAVASTSAEESVRAVLEHAVGSVNARKFNVYAGDIVSHKKPAPDIYLMALERMKRDSSTTIVIEDSQNGVQAACAAGLTTVVTVSSYTGEDDFDGAALVVSSLGDDGERARVVSNPSGCQVGEVVRLADLAGLLAR